MFLINLFQLKAEKNRVFFNSLDISNILISKGGQDKQDSIFKINYLRIDTFYKSKEYAIALSQALSLYNEIKKEDNINDLYSISLLVADIYDKTNNHKRALDFYKNSLIILKKKYLLDQFNRSSSGSELAKTYLRIGSSFQKLSVNDSAIFYYDKLDKLATLNNDVLLLNAISYTNLSGIYEQDSLYDKAKEYANKSINIYKSLKDRVNQANSVNSLGNIYLSQNNFEKAKEIYFSGIDLIKNDNTQNAVRFKSNLYYNLGWAMRNLKEYEAYDFQEMSYEIEDGIREKEYRNSVATIAADYDVNGVKREAENKRLKDQRTFMIYGIGSFIIILSLLYGLNFYKLRQKNLRLKLSQTQLLQNQNIEKLRSESQARILNATIDGKESERKEIAETLHDSVSALLSSANLHLMATKSQFKGEVPIEINKTQDIIAEASQKIRDLSHTLVSSVLLKFGLNYALKDMASKYSNSVLQIDTDIYDIRRYHQNFEIKIYNIIQEFVNNILKHSKAENTIIKLHEKNNRICFQITDDGVGFDKTKVFNKDGLGLNQIDARIQMMNGKFLIESVIGEGTTVFVELPIIEKNTINHV